MADANTKSTVGKAVDVILPLLLLAILIALCVQLLFPFVGLLIWTIIFAVCFYPLHVRLRKKVSNRMSAVIIGLGLSALVLVPTAIASISAAGSIPSVIAAIQTGEKTVPPPPARLQTIPIVGKNAHAAWTDASEDMPAFVKQYRPQLAAFAKTLVGFAGSLFVTVLAIVAAVIFAAITLAYSESARGLDRSLERHAQLRQKVPAAACGVCQNPRRLRQQPFCDCAGDRRCGDFRSDYLGLFRKCPSVHSQCPVAYHRKQERG